MASAQAAGAAGQILELGVSLADARSGRPADGQLASCAVLQDGHELERHPAHQPLDLDVPGRRFQRAGIWSV